MLALDAVRALGITTAGWAADYFRTKKRETIPLVRALAAEGALLPVQVEGWGEDAYVHPDNAKLLRAAAAGRLVPAHTTLLSPFDPLVWDRERALALFDFDYRIECYTPAPKRPRLLRCRSSIATSSSAGSTPRPTAGRACSR
jgi:uncharacterized protein YcaQ